MRRFALAYPACAALLLLFLAAPARAQYPREDPYKKARTPSAELTRLQEHAPNHTAIVYMNDGTLRGGWVTSVDDTHMHMEKQGQPVDLAIIDIATVRIQRPNRTPLYTVLGYALTGTCLSPRTTAKMISGTSRSSLASAAFRAD